MATIQIKRHALAGATGVPIAGADGELAYARGGFTNAPAHSPGSNDLIISFGGVNQTLVSPMRQVEIEGDQTIQGKKTFPLANISIGGGNADETLTTDGNGVLRWAPSGTGGAITQVHHDASMTGDGTSTSLLTLNPATDAQIETGTDNIHAISSIGLRSQLGLPRLNLQTAAKQVIPAINELNTSLGNALMTVAHDTSMLGTGHTGTPLTLNPATTAMVTGGTDNIHALTPLRLREQMGADRLALTTTNKTVIPAINELDALLAVMQGALQLVGSYDANGDHVTYKAGFPATDGPLPPPAMSREGWYVIVQTAGTGSGNAAGMGQIDVADWLICDGNQWLHFAMHWTVVMAGSVGISPIAGIGGPQNVQNALEIIWNTKLSSIFVDNFSIIGDGLTAGNPLRVDVVDGGTY